MNSIIKFLNLWGEQVFQFAWPILWQSSLLIGLVFALDWALRRRVRAAVRYALWLVVLAKLLLPPSLALPTGPSWWLRSATPPVPKAHASSVVVTYGAATAPSLPIAPSISVPLPGPVLSVKAGALVGSSAISLALLGWMLARWRKATHEARCATAAPDWLDDLLERTRHSAGLRRTIRLKLTNKAISPAVCGLFCPVVLLPRPLIEQLFPAQLRTVLWHELVHLQRGDVWVNCLQTLLQVVYWWHPLLWLANVRIRRLREEAVDDAVMLALRDESETYAPTLLEVAKLTLPRTLASLGLLGIFESHGSLRQRIERLIEFHPPRRAGLTAVSVLCVLAFGALAVPMGQGPEKTKTVPASASSEKNPWPDPHFNGYKSIGLEARFLIADETSLHGVLPSLTAPGNPLVVASNEVASLQANLREAGARDQPEIAPAPVFEKFSGGRFQWRIGTSNRVNYQTVSVGDRTIVTGANVEIAAAQRTWKSLEFVMVPWVKDESIRCQLELTPEDKTNATQHAEITLPPGGALVWAASAGTGSGLYWLVLIQPQSLESERPFFGRIFRVDPEIFVGNLNRQTALAQTNQNATVVQAVRNYFTNFEVDLAPPKSVVFNDRAGLLLVQASMLDLDIITREIRRLDMASGSKQQPDSPANEAAASTLVQEGKLLYQTGKLNEAEAKFKQALQENPEQQESYYYLNLIVAAQRGKDRIQPLPSPPAARTNLSYTSSGRQAMYHKLSSIRLHSVTYDGLPLTEVVTKLNDEVKRRDPEGKGINILVSGIINSGAAASAGAGAINSATGLPVPAAAPVEAVDMGKVMIKIVPPLANARLEDVLNAIVNAATRPIKYSVEDYAIIFSPKVNESTPLYTRVFKVDTNNFLAGMRRALGRAETSDLEGHGLWKVRRDFLTSIGVDMTPPKSMFINDREGLLLVRATLQDMDTIEKAIQVLSAAPPQINIRSKFIEIPEESLAYFWINAGILPGDTNEMHILTPAQTAAALKAVESVPDADVLNEASVTTLSGRQTQIQVVDVITNATIDGEAPNLPSVSTNGSSGGGPSPNKMIPIGPTIDFIPHVAANGSTIELSTTVSFTEFSGYGLVRNLPQAYADRKGQSAALPLPHIRFCSITRSAIVPDGHTLALGGLISEAATTNEVGTTETKQFLILITPTLIDSTGNRLHRRNEVPPSDLK